MNKYSPLIIGLSLFLVQTSHADQQTRNIQSALKDAGFYYGAVTGENNAETSAAIRRYQIRNSLQVTGTLNQETSDLLSKDQASPQENHSQVAPQSPSPHVAVDPDAASDPRQGRDSFPREIPVPDPRLQRKPLEPSEPAREDEALLPFTQLFKRSPYERAPVPVQEETLRRVQDKLAGKGFYRGRVDGQPTESVRRAIASYQDSRGLDASGLLDVDTLHEMRLLPGEKGSSFGTRQAPPQRRIYRGIEVQ